MYMALRILALFSAIITALAAGTAAAQSFPNKPLRIIVTEPGGSSDIGGRLIAQALAEPLGQPVTVENLSGVSSIQAAAKAPADGYTLLFYGSGFWIYPLLESVPYDGARDFAPVSLAVSSPIILAATRSVQAGSVKELIALAKARPGTLRYASGANGSNPHLASELFKYMAGVDIPRVAYNSVGPALKGLLAGEAELLFASAGSVAPHVKSGALKALGVASLKPSALAPDLPTIAATLPGYEMTPITGFFVPAGTPAAAVNRLSAEIAKAVHQSDVKDKLMAAGFEPVGSTPEQFVAQIKTEVATMSTVIKNTGMRSQK
jgi:tripartite-type tricarboxylate transporter receptor subunit TctC